MNEQTICGDCGHFFDPTDKRAYIATDPKFTTQCPCCATMSFRGSEMWAVWNDCNGVFEVASRKAEAQRILEKEFSDFQASVVPVRVYLEPNKDDWSHRDWSEAELVGVNTKAAQETRR